VSELGEIFDDLKCPRCGGNIMFTTVIDYRKFKTKTACGRCNEVLTLSVEVTEIKGEE